MGIDAILVIIILVGSVVLFATEVLSVDVVALIILSLLVILGILSPEEGVAGFSNSATVTVGAMFILSAALFKSGAVNTLGKQLSRLFKFNFWVAVFVLMLVAGAVSAFINNTPVVAIFIPLVAASLASTNHSLSKVLMPLSFASMFGGVCTLIGTSTNILVSGMAEQAGLKPIGMFEMTRLGLIFFGVGVSYMMLVGIRLIPKRGEGDGLVQKFGLGDYLTEIILLPHAPSVGKTIMNSPLVRQLEIEILEVTRNGTRFFMPAEDFQLQSGDMLKVKCNIERIKELKERAGIQLKSHAKFTDEDLTDEGLILAEAVIAPNSEFEGKTLKEVNFRQRYGATALAIRHRGEVMREKVASTPLKAGDTLVLEVKQSKIEELKKRTYQGRNSFLFVSEVGLPEYKKEKILPVVATIVAIILVATFNILPIMVAAIAGVVFLLLTRCITMTEAYQAIDWKVIFLLAGAMSLGVAMEKSGAALLMSGFLIDVLGAWGPVAIVSVLYLITSLLTETMSNNASAVLLAPIALGAAVSMNVDPRPFLMAITFAASSSFMTPVGYQTNTMIYGAGSYRYADFLRVGTPLNFIFWILATFLIPYFFPF